MHVGGRVDVCPRLPGLVRSAAQKVVKDEIKRLYAANDRSGVRMWSLVAEQLPRVRTERTRERVFE
jgi:hypothetical protein